MTNQIRNDHTYFGVCLDHEIPDIFVGDIRGSKMPRGGCVCGDLRCPVITKYVAHVSDRRRGMFSFSDPRSNNAQFREGREKFKRLALFFIMITTGPCRVLS